MKLKFISIASKNVFILNYWYKESLLDDLPVSQLDFVTYHNIVSLHIKMIDCINPKQILKKF